MIDLNFRGLGIINSLNVLQFLFTIQPDFINNFSDSQHKVIARTFALLHNFGNIFEYIQVIQIEFNLNKSLLTNLYFRFT